MPKINFQPFPVTTEIYNYIASLTDSYSSATHTFMCRLIRDMFTGFRMTDDLYVPFERNKLRNVNRKILHEEDPSFGKYDIASKSSLVDYKRHVRSEKKSREYRMHDPIRNRLIQIMKSELLSSDPPRDFVNLLDGNPVKGKAISQRKDDKGVTEPELIRKSFNCIQPRIINKTKLLNFLKTSAGSFKHEMRGLNAWTTVLLQGYESIGADLIQYRAAYDVQYTGRISEIRGGFQSAPRVIKDIAYEGIPELYNYDLKSSHLNGSIQHLEDAGISTAWHLKYLGDPKAKENYAKIIDVPIDVWKQALMARLYGAGDGRIYRIFFDHCISSGIGHTKADDYLASFIGCTGTLSSDMRKLSRYLLRNYHKYDGRKYAGKRLGKNPTGKTVYIEDLKKSKLAQFTSFILQGFESAFIHHLTVLSKKYEYRVIGNEHDGLITIGEIPDKAVEEAKKLSGLRYAYLENKPFI